MPNPSTTKKTPSLKWLTTKLKDTQTTLHDVRRFIDGFSESNTAADIEVRLGILDGIFDKFCETLVEIKSHDDFTGEEDSYDKMRIEFSDAYFASKSFLADRMKERQEYPLEQSVRPENISMHGDSLDHVRLPQIKLQTFSGDMDDWLSFRDLYQSLIHWKKDLPEVEKLHYLKGCLQGEPKNLIDPLQITKANYQIAWEMLLKRYNNTKQLKKHHIQSLFKLPMISKESATDLHALTEQFERIVQTLDQIVQPNDYKDLLLVNILSARLDPITRRGWEEFTANKEQDTLKDLMEFLQRRIRVLESLPAKPVDTRGTSLQQQKPKPSAIKASYAMTQAAGSRCVACSGTHLLHQCTTFQKMVVSDREGIIRTNSLCRNCLKAGHVATNCRSKFSCRTCDGRHHTLLCFKKDKPKESAKPVATTKRETASNTEEPQVAAGSGHTQATSDTVVSNSAQQFSTQVLLATAVVVVEDDDGHKLPARALLDSGSESNFMSERLSQRLRVSRKKVDISISGIGQAVSKVKEQIQATICSRVSSFSRSLKFLVLPKVTVSLPTSNINTTGWTIPDGVILADPTFAMSKGVDIVLGIESFFDFFETGRKMSLGEHLPALNESVFGWVVCGSLPDSRESLRISCNVSAIEHLDALVARFWSCEEVESAVRSYSPEEARCESQFSSSVQRGPDGRYTVSLSKDEHALHRLGDSKDIALKRLQGTERRLAKDAKLREQYVAFMDEYLQLGHMRRVEETDDVKRCHLPHHPVVKEASTTTKVRVVFDASCKTSTGVSLNDVLLCGPVIQQDLRSLIYRCRIKQIMLVSDIEKMFRQIGISPEDRALQCILWRSSPSQEVSTFELNTVTYGTKPAPFLATRTLKQLADDEKDRFPLAAKVVAEDIYMDDVITGVDDLDSAISLRTQLDEIMLSGGFQLRKWACNRAEVLRNVPEENLAIPLENGIYLDGNPSVKTLGLTWMPKTDEFGLKFSIPHSDPTEPLTKRTVLSKIASLFDPHGWFGATITVAKLFMQNLWTLCDAAGERLAWDQPIPSTVGENWRQYEEQLPVLSSVRLARCVVVPNATLVELHCFSDASTKAYGGCVYIRSMDAGGSTMVRLLGSKSRVAPLKTQTIPRLELCGAVLVAQLFKVLQHALSIPVKAYFWTDSTCVLCWLHSAPATWSVYVANRVAKIQIITEGFNWNHVPGIQNPADLISRGILPKDIVANRFWWEGPMWLASDVGQWPNSEESAMSEEVDVERRRAAIAVTASTVQEFNEYYLSKFSSYSDLIRRTAIWLRLMKLLRTPASERAGGFLTSDELKEAEKVIVRRVQKETFAEEWKALSSGNMVSRKSPLRWFNPYIDQDQILRVGGRLAHSKEPEDVKHPAVLPARHQLTRMILLHYHLQLLHAGPQLLLAAVRQHFWPLGGRNVARHTVHQCVRCFRSKPKPIDQFMGELPGPRVRISRPFSTTGIDFFGPVYIRPAPRRASVKAYVCLFVCLCTKAVHLELASDLSTDCFLQALRRFFARRGPVSEIWSDNGTNFVGARNKLQELFTMLKNNEHREKVAKECADRNIRWKFSPPSGPHFGGLWESAVRSAKHHILRVIGEEAISIEDMNTLLAQVEACLNSRPLTPMSDDPNDLQPLTPAHFLVGSSLEALPDQDFQDIPTNRLNHYQQIQKKLQHFWNRWRREYLCQLQARTKHLKPPVKLLVGKLVVIVDENTPPLRWKMARITEVHPGSDNVVRVVTLKTATRSVTRPVTKICLLPTGVQEDSSVAAEV